MNQSVSRRKILKCSTLLLGAAATARSQVIGADPQNSAPTPDSSQTIQQIIDRIIKECVNAPFKTTVDTVKSGDPTQKVTGIVTTFLATDKVIQKAGELGANFIITHEPTFYNHLDDVKWLSNDSVYQFKRQLLETNKIVVWRFHDYWHAHKPDGVMTGVLRELGWENYAEKGRQDLCAIPEQTLSNLMVFFKKKLGISKIQMTGDPTMICRKVAFSVGAAGGGPQIHQLSQSGAEVLVVGEINEWETCEYARDAVFSGQKKALIILGHANSEEAGMKYLAEWLKPLAPGITITHVPCGEPLAFV
jgi:putative NIF3 family GTP cyclohydrolase 1 type 2